MNERKDRTLLIVGVIVILGVLASLIGACVAGGVVSYLVARRQVKAAAERLDLQKPEEPISPPQLPESWKEFWRFELPELPEEFPLRLGEGLSGAWILEVMSDTPADRAGLRQGDLITAVNGQRVDDDHPLEELIRNHMPGDSVEITYRRGEKEHEVSVKLGEHPDDPEQAYLGVRVASFFMRQRRFDWPSD